LGPDHREVASVLEHYAVPLRKTGRTTDAEAAENRIRIIRDKLAQRKKKESPFVLKR
jgi:hypothetical protein